jgi:hypothetical protein
MTVQTNLFMSRWEEIKKILLAGMPKKAASYIEWNTGTGEMRIVNKKTKRVEND